MNRKTLIVAASLLAIAGCTTPQAVRDSAKAGAHLAVELEESLADFRATQARIARQRVESIRLQQALMARYESESAFDDRIRSAAGNSIGAGLMSELRSLSDSRAADAAQLEANLADIDARMAKIVAPLPDNTAPLKETQKAMAAMAAELSAKERVSEAFGFAKTVKKTVDANKKKADETADAAGAAPQPAAPASAAK